MKIRNVIISCALTTIGVSGFVFATTGGSTETNISIATIFPEIPVSGCKGGRAKLYDECSSQVELFNATLVQANAEDKTLLVSFGAEWCIWCHVFDAYIRGEHTEFTHTFATPRDADRSSATIFERAPQDTTIEATNLATYFSKNFVLVHIDTRYAEDGYAVLDTTNTYQHFDGGLPFIFSVDPDGDFIASLDHEKVETRRDTNDWFRGYHRQLLTQDLNRMRASLDE